MTIDDELTLSYFEEVGVLDREHSVFLVRHIQSKRLCVKKELTVYNAEVYYYLMEHPVANTPRIIAAAEHEGVLTVIEEYLDGTDLQSILNEGPIEKEEAIGIAVQLCRIVSSLHNCVPAIIHRDIKPSNIIITDEGAVKLLDMNAAKQQRDEANRDTVLIGTVGYAAPEQYGFGTSRRQTDIYAIGVLMAVMAYGRFDRACLGNDDYDKVIEKCTRMDPNDRYSDCDGIILALSHREEAPVQAPQKEKTKRNLRFLPPGFRTLNPAKMLLSILVYFLIFAFASTVDMSDVSPGEVLWTRLLFAVCPILIILMVCNYMDVWGKLGITELKHRASRIAVIVLICILIVLAMLVLLPKPVEPS